MVSVLIEEIDMSDAIREAFEALEQARHKFQLCGATFEFDTIMSALQSQTAPAVPDNCRELVKQYRDAVEYSHKVRRNSHSSLELNVALIGQETIERQIDAMLAAPQPDHSGYTSEVADDLPGMWDQSDLSGGETDVRPPKHHTLKTDPAVYDRSAMGRKPWEIRLNDRDYQVGDTVTLQETKHSGAEMQQGAPLEFTGNEITGQITYVLRGPKYGLADGWCIFSVEPDHIADAGKVDEDRRCLHGIRHPHPCRECEDAPLPAAEAGKVLPVAIPDSDFDETNPIHQAADAYSYACEIMEQHQAERVDAGKDPGTIGSLCDGIAWLYERIQELEDATPSVPEQEAGKVVWAVIDHEGQIAYSIAPNQDYREEWAISSCHEHINEAIADNIAGAADWVVRPLTIGRLRASQQEGNTAGDDGEGE